MESLARWPIAACVVALLPAVFLSHFSHLETFYAREKSIEYAKLVIYFLLLLANVDSPRRLDQFQVALLAMLMVLTGLALLTYFGVLDIESLRPLSRTDDTGGAEGGGTFLQLQANGVFGDPNDFCLALTTGMALCLYRATDPSAGAAKVLWWGPLVGFCLALALTKSRGGFLGMVIGMLVLFHARYGKRKAIALSALALPAAFALFAGRSTSISTDGTAQDRIHLWSDGLGLLKQNPLFGIGAWFSPDALGLETHNTFVQAFTELGLFGGTLFVGVFYIAVVELVRLGSPRAPIADPDLRRFRPYLLAIVAAWCGGMFSISRLYVIPLYMVAGMAAVFIRDAETVPPTPSLRMSGRLLGRMAAAGVGVVAFHYVYVRIFARWGGG
jgi:O-antigen ligase